MSQNEEHLKALLDAPAAERSAAAEALLRSLESDVDADDDAQAAWSSEIERRVLADSQGIPASEAFARVRETLDKIR